MKLQKYRRSFKMNGANNDLLNGMGNESNFAGVQIPEMLDGGYLKPENFDFLMPQKLPLKLYAKINAVIKEVSTISKNGYNSEDGYSYVQATDIVGMLRPILADKGLRVRPYLLGRKSEPRTINGEEYLYHKVRMLYVLIDVESGEYEYIPMDGEAMDLSDKGFYTALTGAYKYMLNQTFMISSHKDDPEANKGRNFHIKTNNKIEKNDKNKNENGLENSTLQNGHEDAGKSKKEKPLITENQLKKLLPDRELVGLSEEQVRELTIGQANHYINNIKNIKKKLEVVSKTTEETDKNDIEKNNGTTTTSLNNVEEKQVKLITDSNLGEEKLEITKIDDAVENSVKEEIQTIDDTKVRYITTLLPIKAKQYKGNAELLKAYGIEGEDIDKPAQEIEQKMLNFILNKYGVKSIREIPASKSQMFIDDLIGN
jgi:hypothetical protein